MQHSLSLGLSRWTAGPLDRCSGHPHLAPLDESFGSAASWRWRRSSKGFRADFFEDSKAMEFWVGNYRLPAAHEIYTLMLACYCFKATNGVATNGAQFLPRIWSKKISSERAPPRQMRMPVSWSVTNYCHLQESISYHIYPYLPNVCNVLGHNIHTYIYIYMYTCT